MSDLTRRDDMLSVVTADVRGSQASIILLFLYNKQVHKTAQIEVSMGLVEVATSHGVV